ncbi:MAG TPA: toll/interleukin-1 receptor domain-containing protein, partial [Ktedonobacterales bacterium]|nr:toll/interleukin-1 receptor domain-containing protein [Ktedonobacterales bacterium]
MTTPSPASVPRIFVSHSHADNDFGVRLVTTLRTALGGDEDSVWFDISGGAHGGDTLWRKIVQEITDRPIFIVVASPHALASPWVMNEINIAWTLKNTRPNRHIVPVLYEVCDLPADLLMQLYVSFLPPQTFEAGLASLVTAIHALAGTRPTPPPAAPVGASGGRPPAPAEDPATARVRQATPLIEAAFAARD